MTGAETGLLVISVAALFLLFAVLAMGVRTVPQGEEWVVERFGRYLRTLPSGLSLIIPLFDRVAYRVVTKDIVLDIDQQEVITSDNAVIMTNAVAFIKVSDPIASVLRRSRLYRGCAQFGADGSAIDHRRDDLG